MKEEEFKAESEEKTRSLENYFPKHPQRCPPSFLQDIESQEVYEGDSCKFVCHFQGYPQPIVTWYNNELPIPRSQGFTIHTFENYSTLTFPSVQPQHGGSVTCVLFNQYGTVKATSMLRVRAKPRYDSQPHKVPVWPDYTDEEEELALVFDQARRIHPSFSQERQEHLHMLKTHLPEFPSTDREPLSFPVEIQITTATPTPEQNKECWEQFELETEATSRDQAIQSPKHKFTFSSDITNEPPKMLQEMPRSAKCREGDSVMLECLISGEPRPVVTWFHNGVLVKQNQKFEIEEVNCSYRLYIIDVSSHDSGKYQCVAENSSGTAESILDLTVEPITYREDSQLENISGIYAQYSNNQQTQVQEESVRTHFYDNLIGPLAAQSNIKEYTVKEYFQSLETVGQVGKQNEVYCPTSSEKLSKSMQGASRPTDINKLHRTEFLQCQDEGHIHERSQSLQAEATTYPFVDDFREANIRNKVRDDFGHHGPQWESMKGPSQSDYMPNIHSKRTSDAGQDVEDSPVPTYEEAFEGERYYPGKKVKHKIIAFERLQHAEKGGLEKRRTKKSFVTAPQKRWDNREFLLKQKESGESNIHRAEEVASHTEADSSNIIMDLKQLSSQVHEEFEIEERGPQEEMLPLDQEKVELEAPVTFDLKRFQSQIESTGMNFQDLANGQQDKSSLKTQQPASEMANPKDIVFDLKQMYSHIEDPGETFQDQETENKQETCHKEEISIYQSFQYAQEENTTILKTDHGPESFSEVVHGESWALFQTPSADMEETNISEANDSAETRDKSFISELKRATSEEEPWKDHEMEDRSTLRPACGVTQGYEGTLEYPRGNVHEADAPHRQLSLSQDLPFLMTGEQQDLTEQISESIEASGEETHHEVHIQNESSFSTMEGEKIEKSLPENLPRLEEAQTTEEGGCETSLTQYLLTEGRYEVPDVRDTKHKAQPVQSESITSMEVEEVTFNTVYEYYNQKQESLGRSCSPESDISIDVGSTSSEDMSELDQFYSPPSSVEHLESPKSPDLYFKPSDIIEQSIANSRAEENGERYSTPSEGEIPERYSTPSGEALERYSTPPGEALERYSTPPGEALERFSTPPGEALERFSTPPGEALERFSTPPGEKPERGFIPTRGPNHTRNVSMNLSKLEREDSTANEHFHTPTDERSSPYDTWRSDSFSTPNEAIEPKDNEMPPSFIEPLSKRKIYENTTLGFIIEVEGLPVPGVKWYRNKSLLEPDDRIKMERVGNVCSLEISNIQKGDGGAYMCHAVNIIGEAKSFANVDVIPQEERAVALPPPVTHQHIMEFDVANTNSSRTPSPQEIVLEVELSEKDVKEFEKQVKIVTVPEFTADHKSMVVSLDILPLSLVEPGAESQGKEGTEFQIDLEAFEMPPRFITPVCDFRIPENSTAVFKCSVIGIPPPEVKWYKEYLCIEPDDMKYLISEEKGSHSLRIQDVGPSDSATYRCRALNSAGEAICRGFLTVGESQVSAMATRTSKVTLSSQKEELVLRSKYADSFFEFQVVEGPPRFIKGISDCHAPLGTAAYFQCLVRGSPRPTVSWYKDGKLVQGSRFSAEESGIGFHNLFITGLTKGDEGEYSCIARNNSGMARSSAILTLS